MNLSSETFAQPGIYEVEVEPKWDALPAQDKTEAWIRLLCYRLRKRTKNLKEARKMSTATSYPGKGISGPESTPASAQNEHGFIHRLLSSWNRPMSVVGGVTNNAPVDNRVPRPVISEDKELLDKTAHVRRKNEKILELVARTGISPNQIREFSKVEIAKFVALSEQNAMEEPPRRYFEAPALPNKIKISLI